MTDALSVPPFRPRGPWGSRIAALVFVLAAIAGLWWASTQQSTSTRKAAETSLLIPLLAPEPPPPPPPPEEVIKPEETPQDVPPVPADQPAPTPQAPQAASAPGNAVSIDGPAQAGGDGFNIGAGSGGGTRGSGPSGLSGFNRAAYANYLQGEIKRAVEADKELRSTALETRTRIWIDSTGRITRAEVSGDKADRIRAALVGRMVRAPDPSLSMPVVLSLDIRKPR